MSTNSKSKTQEHKDDLRQLMSLSLVPTLPLIHAPQLSVCVCVSQMRSTSLYLYSFFTWHLTQLYHMSERKGAHTSERENNYQISSLCFWVLLLLLVLILSLRKLWGFFLYGFPEKKSFCLLSLVMCLCYIAVLVILSVKILT